MADGVASGVNATKGFLKNHWLAFAVVAFVIVALALSYDHKNGGKLTAKLASLPLVGKHYKLECAACKAPGEGDPQRHIIVKCWQCGLVFHFHVWQFQKVPVGANVRGLCPDPICQAENVWMRVPLPDFLVNPTDYQPSQSAAWWGFR